MRFDWLTASTAARRELYRTCKRIVDGHFLGDWNGFYRTVFGQPLVAGIGYQDNFRSGRISRSRANAIVKWIAIHHTREAELLNTAIGQLDPSTSDGWTNFVQDQGRDDGLTIVRFADLGIVGFASSSMTGSVRLRLGEQFCLRLEADSEGVALALQCVRGAWFSLPLSAGGLMVTIQDGAQFLPRDASTNEPIPLSDETDGGQVRFVMLIGDGVWIDSTVRTLEGHDAIPAAILDALATSASRASFIDVYVTDALIM